MFIFKKCVGTAVNYCITHQELKQYVSLIYSQTGVQIRWNFCDILFSY